MKRDDQLSYLMIFCALLMVRNSKATLDEALDTPRLSGGADRLAAALKLSENEPLKQHAAIYAPNS